MHAYPKKSPTSRSLVAGTLVALMLLSPLLAAVGPAAGVLVEGPIDEDLPLEWTLGAGESGGFNLSVPAVGTVEKAEATLVGSGVDVGVGLDQDGGYWADSSEVDIEGFDVSRAGLEVSTEHRSVHQGPDDLANYTSSTNLEVRTAVTLAVTSPDFSASGGGIWRYYKQVDVSLNLIKPSKGIVTYISVEILEGRCLSTDELRLADRNLTEVPHQVIGRDLDAGGKYVVHVDILFLSELAPSMEHSYRLYYGNDKAQDPVYDPILLGLEMWNYKDTDDNAFLSRWKALRWVDVIIPGSAYHGFVNLGGDANAFSQAVRVNPGRNTYSQVWTDNNYRGKDFVLTTWVGGLNLDGARNSMGMWGLDFRTSGNDCYRLVLTHVNRTNTPTVLSLYRVANERHLASADTPTNDWTLLEKVNVNLNYSEGFYVAIRAMGPDINVFINNDPRPIIEARDNRLTEGLFGTFEAGQNAILSVSSTTVSGMFGPMYVWSTDVEIADRQPTYSVSEERSQHHLSGNYVSDVVFLDGIRDSLFSLHIELPEGTEYTAELISKESGDTIASDIRDGEVIPAGSLEGGFQLVLELRTEQDWTTPKMHSWGVAYTAAVHFGSGRGSSDADNVVVRKDSLALAPSRDIWLKEETKIMGPGNIPEDSTHVSIDSVVRYGDGYRLYYTGTDAAGTRTICVAETIDGREFWGHQALLPSSVMSTGWDNEKHTPWVIRVGPTWLMFFIGERTVGAVGLAISGNGYNWGVHGQPVLAPSGLGFDGRSIIDCAVIFDEQQHIYIMYYTGVKAGAGSKMTIGYATSTDVFSWTRQGAVINPGASTGDWDTGHVRDPCPVVKRDQIVLYYRGTDGTDSTTSPYSIGYATSDNGKTFVKAPTNPVMRPKEGGLADDFRGIRGMFVMEDDGDRHTMLFSGVGLYDYTEKAFIALSGYTDGGHFTSKSFVLKYPPRVLGPLLAEFVLEPSTTVSMFVRTSPDGNTWSGWFPAEVGEVPEGLQAERFFQLMFDLGSEFGDVTPVVHWAALEYRSSVAFSQLTTMNVYEAPSEIVDVVAEIAGMDLDDVQLETMNASGDWTDILGYGVHADYGLGPSFSYRITVEAASGTAPAIHGLHFTLTHVSMPSEVSLIVGNDVSVDWTHGGVLGEEAVVAEFAEALQAIIDAAEGVGDDGGPDLTVPMSIISATPGMVALTALAIVVDTPPMIVSPEPEMGEIWMDEGTEQHFQVSVEERDGQELVYSWSIDDEEVVSDPMPTTALDFLPDPEEVWDTSFEIGLIVSDGIHEDMWFWTVHVNETTPVVNVVPVIDSFEPDFASVNIDENQSVTFSVVARDPDGGPVALIYRWFIDTDEVPDADGASFSIKTDYGWAGEYGIRVEAFDGEAGVNHTWTLNVKDKEEPKPPNGGNGDGDGNDFNMLPLIIILILGAVGAAGYMVMRSRAAPSKGTGPDIPSEPDPVTADVPLEEELAAAARSAPPPAAPPASPPTGPAPTQSTSTIARSVAAAPPGDAGSGAVAKKVAAAGMAGAMPIAAMPITDMDKDRTFVVEEVYVVYNDGRLMYYEARAERTSVDTDLFGGMFTAIQQFIQDSMGGADSGTQVGRLDYGENRILVERGNHVFLATIIYGEEQESLRETIRDVINRIEGSYAGVIERWSGDQTQLSGVADFVAPLIGLTMDLNRETIMTRTRTVGIKMLSEVEFFQGFVRLKVAVRNDTKTVITNVATDINYDNSVLRIDRIQPEFDLRGSKVFMGTINPREKKTVAYYLDPLICQERDIDGTTSFKDAEGNFKTVTMKRRRADIVCPIFFTEENANTAMLKRLIKEELSESDSKLFTIPKILSPADALTLSKEVVRGHDVRFVREFTEEGEDVSFRGEAWYYGVTKVKKDKMVIRTSVWEDRQTVEFFVASGRIESITGLLAELGQNLNKALKNKYLGRVSAELVIDRDQQDEVKNLGLLIDKYSEGEMDAGEVDQS